MTPLPISAILYGWLMLTGIVVSILLWAPRMRSDGRLATIYLMALVGALVGAKLMYVAAEGWQHFGQPDQWRHLLIGKSIIGALLGGHAAVVLTKRQLGYTAVTGDLFAAVVPIGVAIGRIGCWFAGCCLGREVDPDWWTLDDAHGVSRWPSVPMEFAFNVIMAAIFVACRRRGIATGQHFHLYLIAYGGFRFFHEFLRESPALIGYVSGYQIGAMALIAVGCAGYRRRAARRQGAAIAPAATANAG